MNCLGTGQSQAGCGPYHGICTYCNGTGVIPTTTLAIMLNAALKANKESRAHIIHAEPPLNSGMYDFEFYANGHLDLPRWANIKVWTVDYVHLIVLHQQCIRFFSVRRNPPKQDV